VECTSVLSRRDWSGASESMSSGRGLFPLSLTAAASMLLLLTTAWNEALYIVLVNSSKQGTRTYLSATCSCLSFASSLSR